jgi:hypothetical protein
LTLAFLFCSKILQKDYHLNKATAERYRMTPVQFVSYAEQMLAPTVSLFQLVPENNIDWRPVEGAFTCGQLMHHMAGALRFNANGIGKNEWALPSLRHIFLANRREPSSTVEEAVALYKETSHEFFETFRRMPEEEFLTGIINTPQFGPQEKWRHALFSVSHHLNHKTELFMYLKVMGIKVSSRELYGG